jgi:rubrerythrin
MGAGYGAARAVPGLGGSVLSLLERFRAHELEHARALSDTLTRLGHTPSGAPAAKPPPGATALRSTEDVFRYAASLERRALAAYWQAEQRLSDPGALTLVTRIMAAEGQHLVVWRGRLGEDPVPQAFEHG